MVVYFFYEISAVLKDHEFSDFVHLPKKEFSDGYNELLIVLNNMSFSDYKALVKSYYTDKILKANIKGELQDFLSILILGYDESDVSAEVNNFKSKYPKSLFIQELNYRFCKSK